MATKHTFAGDFGDLARFGVFDFHTFNAERVFGASDFDQFVEPEGLDLRVLFQAINQDFFSAQFVAAVYERNL